MKKSELTNRTIILNPLKEISFQASMYKQNIIEIDDFENAIEEIFKHYNLDSN